jgi:pilus assembly protein CpaB
MRSKSIVLLALALGCGLVASIGISQVMDRHNSGDAPVAETEPVFVAAVDINYNDQVTKEKLKIEEWPKDKIHADALRTLDQIKGQRAAHKIFAGEQIRGDKLMGADGQVSGSDKIPAGYRVVSVRVDAVTGASGLILPNDRVDVLVYLARNPGAGIEETSTKTILQDIRVFAVDTQFERRKGSDEPAIAAKTISLLVTPFQAEKVTLATEMGTLRLVMRSPDDSLEGSAGGASVKDIFNQGEKVERQNEDQPTAQFPGQAGNNAAAWLDRQKQVQPPPIVAAPVEVQPQRPRTWKMTLVEGSDVRQVELDSDNQFPDLNAPATDEATGDQGQDAGSSDSQELPPVTETP